MAVSFLVGALLQAGTVPLDSGWSLSGERTRIEPHRGVPAVWIDNGRAIRRSIQLGDGTIEFDVEMLSHRSFVYLQFRMESDTEFEEIYFRPHKTGLPDAVQYNPVWRGDSFWQLWHGPDASASPRFRFGQWTHVRLVLQGARGALFLDHAAEPVMVMNLARAPRSGYIALRAFNPDAALSAGDVAARFANVSVQPGTVAHDFGPAVAAPVHEPGSILRWQISPAFKGAREPVTQLPQDLLQTKGQWPSYPVERSGVVAIGRHIDRPRPDGAAIARLLIRSSGPRLQRLYLGYSDYVTVFVNGTPVFAGDAHYSFDQPRQEGLIGPWQSTLWLPLRDGENEILLAVVDGFGGWALTGRLNPDDGGVLVPPP
jgi:hypothetical protein